jgi:hypothetical protein
MEGFVNDVNADNKKTPLQGVAAGFALQDGALP